MSTSRSTRFSTHQLRQLFEATFNALPGNMATLDDTGQILAVNNSWRLFADANGLGWKRYGVGVNYLTICDEAASQGDSVAEKVAQGIRAVLDGQRAEFRIEYPCHRPDRRQWFILYVNRLTGEGAARAVVFHQDVTDRQRAEDWLRIQRDLGLGLGAATEMADIWRHVLASASKIESVDCGGIYLLDETTGQFDLVSHYGLSSRFVEMVARIQPGSPQAKLVLKGQSAFGSYLQMFPGNEEHRQAEGLRAFAVIPIRYEGGVLGSLNLASRTCPDFPLEVRAFLESLGARVGGVTARVRAESALRESEERFRQLAENIPQVFSLFDHNQKRTLYVSPTYEDIFGLSVRSQSEDTLAFMRAVYEEDRPKVMSGIESVRQGTQVVLEYRLRGPDGSVRWVRTRAFPIRNGRGEVFRSVAITGDITDAKLIEEALRRRDAIMEAVSFAASRFMTTPSWKEPIAEVLERLGNAARVSRVYIFENQDDENGRCLTSQRYEWVADGIEPQIDKPELQNSDLVELGFGRWVDVLRRGEVVHGHIPEFPVIEQAILTHQSILSILVVPIFEGERWWGFIGFDECVRERDWSAAEVGALKAAAAILAAAIQRTTAKEALHLTQFAVDRAAEAIYWVSVDGRLIYANEAASRQVGYSREELLAMRVPDIDLDFPPETWLERWAALKRNNPSTFESRHRAKDGRVFPIEITTNHFTYSGREYVCAFVRDITQRRAAAEEETHRRDEMAHVLRVNTMGEMASGLAHELNQPLAAIVNYAEACLQRLRRSEDRYPELMEDLQQICSQADRAGQIVHRVRNFVRRGVPERTLVNLNEIAREMAQFQLVEARRKGVQVRLALLDDLPCVRANKVQIEQVILNLIRNGIEAACEGSRRMRELCLSSTNADSGLVQMDVRDSGPGLSPDIESQIFEPFFTTKPHGLGLGLPISQSIIEAHGGRLWTSVYPGGGTIFHFTLPIFEERTTP